MKRYVKSIGATMPNRGLRALRRDTAIEVDPVSANGHHLLIALGDAVRPRVADYKNQSLEEQAEIARRWKYLGEMFTDLRTHCMREWRDIRLRSAGEREEALVEKNALRAQRELRARVKREKQLASEGLLASGRPVRTAVPPRGM